MDTSQRDTIIENSQIIEKVKQQQKVTELRRGGCVIQTKIGNIQYSVPPETIKDCMNQGIDMPNYYILPRKFFELRLGVSVAEIEFPMYFNFFIKKKKITILCTEKQKKILQQVVQETLLGPTNFENLELDFHHNFPKNEIPNLEKELLHFNKNPMTGTKLFIDDLINFITFDDKGQVLIEDFTIQMTDESIQFYNVNELTGFIDITKIALANYPSEIYSTKSQSRNSLSFFAYDKQRSNSNVYQEQSFKDLMIVNEEQINSLQIQEIPVFGITAIGNSHGFDPKGTNSGFILWINQRGIMVDPPPFSLYYLQKNGISYQQIDSIIISHCHSDHDGGSFQKILNNQKVEIITTRTIMDSYLRKYSALLDCKISELNEMFLFRPAIIGKKLKLHGAEINFFYSFHTIPCIGFEVYYQGKSIRFSGDHFYDPSKLKEIKELGVFNEERYKFLAEPNFNHDVILHEAGVAPIHSPQSVFFNLPKQVKDALNLYHIAAKDIKTDQGLKHLKTGLKNSIILVEKQQQFTDSHDDLEKLETLSRAGLFDMFCIKSLRTLCDNLEFKYYNKGEMIIKEGEAGSHFYIIIKGIAKIYSTKSENTFIRYCQMGDYFGESVLFEQSVRKASVTAATNVQLISIEREQFFFLFGLPKLSSSISYKLLNLFNARQTNQYALLQQNKALQQLNSNQLSKFEEMLSKTIVIKAGEYIWEKDKKARFVCFIQYGTFLVTQGNSKDKVTTSVFLYDFHKNAEGKRIRESTVQCLQEGAYFFIRRKKIRRFFQSFPGLKYQFAMHNSVIVQ